jgi:hypothetical protein
MTEFSLFGYVDGGARHILSIPRRKEETIDSRPAPVDIPLTGPRAVAAPAARHARVIAECHDFPTITIRGETV